jgi:hypothetical protein
MINFVDNVNNMSFALLNIALRGRLVEVYFLDLNGEECVQTIGVIDAVYQDMIIVRDKYDLIWECDLPRHKFRPIKADAYHMSMVSEDQWEEPKLERRRRY